MCWRQICIIVLFLGPSILSAWVKRNPNPTAATMTSVAYGAGKFVVAATGPTNVQMLYSDDALNWKEGVIPGGGNMLIGINYQDLLYGVVYDEKIGFVALCGDPGMQTAAPILMSPDGVNWTVYPNQNKFNYWSIGGNGVIVNVRADGMATLVSRDGLNYTKAASPGRNVAFLDGQFIAYSGTIVYRSADFVTWSPLLNLTGIVQSAWVGAVSKGKSGEWVAVFHEMDGSSTTLANIRTFIVRSDNGRTWTNVTEAVLGCSDSVLAVIDDVFMLTLTAADGAHAGIFEHVHMRSADGGRTWTNASADVLQTVLAVNGRFIATLGNDFVVFEDIPGLLQVSTDLGVTWQSHNNGITSSIANVISVDNAFVIAASDGVYASYNGGATWIHKTNISLVYISYDETQRRFYGALSSWLTDYGSSAIAVSTDLVKWDIIPGPVTDTFVDLHGWQATGAAWTGGHWVVPIVYGKDVPSNGSSSSSILPPSNYIDIVRIFVSNSTGGWQLVNATTALAAATAGSGPVTLGIGMMILELENYLAVSYDNGRTWRAVTTGGQQYAHVCSLRRASNMWFYGCTYPKPEIRYAYDSNLDAWNVTNGTGTAVAVSWLKPNPTLPQGKFVAAGASGLTWESTDGVKWQPGPRINAFSEFDYVVASSSGDVVAVSPVDNWIYSSTTFPTH